MDNFIFFMKEDFLRVGITRDHSVYGVPILVCCTNWCTKLIGRELDTDVFYKLISYLMIIAAVLYCHYIFLIYIWNYSLYFHTYCPAIKMCSNFSFINKKMKIDYLSNFFKIVILSPDFSTSKYFLWGFFVYI